MPDKWDGSHSFVCKPLNQFYSLHIPHFYTMKLFNKMLIGGLVALGTLGQQAMATADFNANRTDFRDETIYFAMTTRFYDGDPKNNVCTWDKQEQQISSKDPGWRGDFAGLIEKLDYIKALGFTAIWITPIVQNASGIDYHGYHAMDFSNVDLRYESRTAWGSEKDVKFQDLIDAAHAKGMKIVLDVVLQHTGNFGEAKLNPLFTRNQNIRNQANIEACMMPDNEKLGGASYWKLPNEGSVTQYSTRWKYFKNPEYEPNNFYHHYGTGWNWDLPNRWWGQIAGDCVDLNTENDAVAEYIVECYGKFIEMGVDAFRIDTSGHISPLTFNKQFIPQFQALGEKFKSKRLNQAPFYMFGEVCQRFQGSVVYRDQPNLSSYFYTWKSDNALLNEFNGDPAWWRQQTLPEGHDTPVGPMAVCEKDTRDKARSNNAWMQNGAWHEPDYSQSSGFNVIDFPVHYSFKNVGEIQQYFNQDNYYNDASFNVVYVDSHDYGPGPNDGIRFNGGTAQWAENLSWMFTFRGVPCLYYGSEVEFQAGKTIDDGMNTKLSDTGRAYFGHYLEGNVTATDFSEFTASGQVAETLKGDLAHHIQQLNKIRAAVPALRKGQYTFDGCNANGGWAFKRAYKDSYALVAVNGGATFTGVPAGTYVDLVTGQSYNGGGSITVDAPKGQGQLRVLVKGWTGGKLVEDGKFMYASSPVAHGGNPTATDPGASFFYTKEDAIDESVGMTFSPNGGSFKTETLTVTATLTAGATSGTITVPGQSAMTINQGETKTFTVGQGMNYGETVTVSWTATGKEGNANGSVTYKKVDPNAVITVYCKAASAPNLYAWSGSSTALNGAWPGNKMTQTTTVNGINFYYMDFPGEESINIIFSNGSAQTGDITGITESVYYEYDGGSNATKLNIDDPTPQPTKPVVTASPASGTNFSESIKVTLSVKPSVAIHYTIDGSTPSASSATYSQPLTFTETTTLKTFVENEAGSNVQTFTYTKTDTPTPPTPGDVKVYVEGVSSANIYVYKDGSSSMTSWEAAPAMTSDASTGYLVYTIPDEYKNGLVIIKANGGQYPETNQPGLALNGKSMKLTWSSKSWTEYQSGGDDPTPPTPPTPGTGFKVYFQDSSVSWNPVYCYTWTGSNQQLGAWPGTAMTATTLNGSPAWVVTVDADTAPENVIFNCGSDQDKTGDLTFTPNGIYNKGGQIGMSSIGDSYFDMSATNLDIRVINGQLVIYSDQQTTIPVTSLTGQRHMIDLYPGFNTIESLANGFYVVEGQKVMLNR